MGGVYLQLVNNMIHVMFPTAITVGASVIGCMSHREGVYLMLVNNMIHGMFPTAITVGA